MRGQRNFFSFFGLRRRRTEKFSPFFGSAKMGAACNERDVGIKTREDFFHANAESKKNEGKNMRERI